MLNHLGYRTDAEGLHATTAKIETILNAPKPVDISQLISFLAFGLINHYGSYIPNLGTVAHPFNNLRTEYETAFQTLKQHLTSPAVLVYYDTQLPIKMACDVSAYGVEAVISHVMPDSSRCPIAYGCHSLSTSKQDYSQLEKEALGPTIIFGIKNFHKFLYGRPFTLVTDHKPLVTILGPKAPIPTLEAACLQRWALSLSGYIPAQGGIPFHHRTWKCRLSVLITKSSPPCSQIIS